MANVQIFITPTSITIYDGKNNRVAVRKTVFGNFKKAEITPEISVTDTRVQNNAVELGNLIIKFLANKKPKDSYTKGFAKLHRFLTTINTHSLETLKNRLEREMYPNAEVKPVETVMEAIPEMQEMVG
jgi:hypothetical protein